MVERLVQTPSVAIILVNWNGLAYTLECIESLRAVSHRSLKIIVVDNGSEPSQVDPLKEIDTIHLIENGENLGFTGGNNVGIQYAIDQGFDLIMLLNNDTLVEPNFLDPLVAVLQKEETGAVQPKILQMDSKHIWSLGGKFNTAFGKAKTIGAGKEDLLVQSAKAYNVDWLTGCCLFVKTSVFKEIGLLDNKYFALCEDVDWSLRAKEAGYVLKVVPSAVIYHHESASDKSKVRTTEGYRSPFRQYLNVRNHLYLVRKFVPWYFKPLAFCYYAIRSAIFACYYLLRNRPNKLRMTLKGFRDGIKE